jgi:hypothetical protein
LLEVLAEIQPPWTLTGGAALAGFHLGHRITRDLDLFWHGRATLGEVRDRVMDLLRAQGLRTAGAEQSDSFCRLRVTDGHEEVLLDLVAEPIACVEAPLLVGVGNRRIQVDTPHEILVNKLCSLLSRSELRDLIDVEALLRDGGDLARACRGAAQKDAGFSPLTLQWLLRDFPVARLAERQGLARSEADRLQHFRDALVGKLARVTMPDA